MSVFHQLTATTLQGASYPFSNLKGRLVLLINVASKCGFTKQYAGLEKLHESYKGKGLEVIGVPCNQFGAQEPGSSEEIVEFCRLTYGVSFSLLEKQDVNGPKESELFKFLKNGGDDIKWNFEKFLVSADGTVLKRFGSRVTPEEIEVEIKTTLTANGKL